MIGILLISATLFISCSNLTRHPSFESDTPISQNTNISSINTYGSYLAGRVAHMRQDFGTAAAYYQQTYNRNQNPDLIDKLYLLYASQGNVDQASQFAQKAIEKNSNNSFARIVIATKQINDKDYTSAIKTLSHNNETIHKTLITPIINAWNYAGLNSPKKSFAELNKIAKTPDFIPIYRFHKAMLHDFFGQNLEAQTAYLDILGDDKSEISVRFLELITNFFIRTGQKEQAIALMSSTRNNQALNTLLATLRDKVISADPKTTRPILDTASVGVAEALFTIASTLRYEEALDIAHMYTALATYINPNYSTAKILMADIYETREMYDDANRLYDDILDTDIAYYPAQLKKARNLVKQGDNKSAEILLKSLNEDYDDIQIYIELGDILRNSNRFSEAIRYYDKAISKTQNQIDLWVLYYTKGIALERANKWAEAEASLMKAYNIKKHYIVLNHLGYSWIRQNQNIDQAFDMIVDAYNQAPFEASINDSLGFALYNLGYYTMSLPYLERAAELYPSSAVINSHLGDAYWFAHRQNEAKFQWQHALRLKDESGELDSSTTKNKIKHGIKEEPKLTYTKEKIEQSIKKIKRHLSQKF